MDLLAEIKTDEEAMLLLSALGFSMADWPCINKLGGPNQFLASKLVEPCLKILKPVKDYRARLDHFLATDGFMFSAIKKPSPIFKCSKAPLAFLGRFNQELLAEEDVISVVGSRNASALGLNLAKKLGESLAKEGVTVASGGAIGIDKVAHQSALLAGGKTIAISGAACDLSPNDPCAKFFYPHAKKSLVIYPYGPFLPQQKFMFVERNRFVAAIAKALVVVEGKVGSGTLHTANYAKKLGVPLYAVPGALDNPLAFAPNSLLVEGHAQALGDFQQFARIWVAKTANTSKKLKKVLKDESCETELPELLRLFRENKNSLGFDELLKMTGKSYSELQRELFDFELSGRILKRGSQFVLTGH